MKALLGVLATMGMVYGAEPSIAAQQKELAAYERVWAGKLGVVIPIRFEVKSELEIIRRHIELTGQLPTGMIYGLDGPTNTDGTEVFVWIMRLQDYPEYASSRKARRDQRDTVVHELVHILIHTYGEEGAVRHLADYMVKHRLDQDQISLSDAVKQ